MPFFCNIGCNIVDPEIDDIPEYTKSVYLRRIRDYRAMGFRHLEFSHLLALSRGDAEEIRECCRRTGIVPWSVHSEHLNEGERIEDYLRTQEHCAEIAEALDARVMVCHLPNLEPRFDFGRAVSVLSRLAEITGRHGLRLAVENCAFPEDVDFIIRILDGIGRPDVGFNLDTGHAFACGLSDVAGVVKKIGKRLFTTHLHDNFGKNDDHQPPGLGEIDWKAVLRALDETGYDGPLMLEMTGPGVKARRSVPELRKYDLEKELTIASACLHHFKEAIRENNRGEDRI